MRLGEMLRHPHISTVSMRRVLSQWSHQHMVCWSAQNIWTQLVWKVRYCRSNSNTSCANYVRSSSHRRRQLLRHLSKPSSAVR